MFRGSLVITLLSWTVWFMVVVPVQPFVASPLGTPVVVSTTSSSTVLEATAKNKKKKKGQKPTASSSSFGGASMAPCPCGSTETYNTCCATLHRSVDRYKQATAEQVVRARYAAFAQKQPDFLILSTHPLNKDFNPDLKKWKESIRLNMYDNFDLPHCVIVDEQELEPVSFPNSNLTLEAKQVQFIATMVLKDTGETTAFMETARLERAPTHGGWLYLNGTIDAVPPEFAAQYNITLVEQTVEEEEEEDAESDKQSAAAETEATQAVE